MQLSEQYRPQSWDDVIGQDKVVRKIQAIAKRGLAGKAYWLSGPSGTGKTTIGLLIARDVADEFSIEEVDATTLTTARLTELEKGMQIRGWGKGGRAYLINEAHGLRRDVIRQMLVLLERIPPHVVIVFTTTSQGQKRLFEDYDDASPLLSRCIRLELTKPSCDRNDPVTVAFARRAKAIAEKEGLGGKDLFYYQGLVVEQEGNLRAVLSAIEAGEMLAEPEPPKPAIQPQPAKKFNLWKALAEQS